MRVGSRPPPGCAHGQSSGQHCTVIPHYGDTWFVLMYILLQMHVYLDLVFQYVAKKLARKNIPK